MRFRRPRVEDIYVAPELAPLAIPEAADAVSRYRLALNRVRDRERELRGRPLALLDGREPAP